MIRATRVIPAGEWSYSAADCVTLDHDRRHRRRMAMTGIGGLGFLLDLGEAVPLRHGDGLLLEDGRIVEVAAAPEPLAEIAAGGPADLVRIAWHLGNRHFAAQILGERIRIRRDHVIEALMLQLGATVEHIEAPFEPEGGAYGHHKDS